MKVPLSEICESKINALASHYNGKIDYLDISSIDSENKSIVTYQSMDADQAPSRAKQLILPNDILVSTVRPNLNAVAVVDIQTDNLQVASTGYCILRCKPNAHFRYVFHFCVSQVFIDDMVKQATGASYPAVNNSIVRSSMIKLPPLAEQQEIAAELDKISGLIAKRKSQIEKMDLLVKAKFVEMFGLPKQNPMGWPMVCLGEVVESITSGWSANGEARKMKSNEKAVLKVSAVTQGYFRPEEHKVIDLNLAIKKNVYPQKGDLLFSRANTRELVGATAIINQDYPNLLLPDKLWKVLFHKEINVYYAKSVLSTADIRKEFSECSTGTSGSMFNVSTQKFKEILVPLPPLSRQTQFADFVQKVEQTKSTMQKSLERLEILYKTRMQEYFE